MGKSFFLCLFFISISTSIVTAAQEADIERPIEHLCPITLAVMEDPVITCDGHSYERSAITRYFETCHRSPITNLPIEKTLIPNLALKALICDWNDKQSKAIATRSTQNAVCDAVLRPMNSLTIPEIARGYEDIYLRFVNSVLIYQPNQTSEDGRIEMPIASLLNPLEGIFDLSKCGNTWQHLIISTGNRKIKKIENASKVEIWLAPRFLIRKKLSKTIGHRRFDSPFVVFFNHGSWDSMKFFYHCLNPRVDDSCENDYPLVCNLQALYDKAIGYGGVPRCPSHHPISEARQKFSILIR